MFQSIAHIGLTVSNLDRSIDFYQNVLNLEYVGEMKMQGNSTDQLFDKTNTRARVAYLKTKDAHSPLIELIQFENMDINQQNANLFQTSISELCLYCEDIDQEYQRLKEKGVEFLSEPQEFDSTKYGFGKSKAVYFKDPDGIILEIIQNL